MYSILSRAFVTYEKNLLEDKQSDKYFEIFDKSFEWKYNDYGTSKLKRQTCAFADKEIASDRQNIPPIWGNDIIVNEWTPELLEIKKIVESKVKELTGIEWTYNVVLCNRYTRGKDLISFHSDNEELGNTKSIASVSLGVPRTFTFLSKNLDEKCSLLLEHNSLLFMGENCQENYRHGMKKENLSEIVTEEILTKFNKTRINLTFRIWNKNVENI